MIKFQTPIENSAYGTENQPYMVQNGPPPSYTSLPPPIPAIVLPPIIHPTPPPTYEQTFGLRYLDRDQPVLVFNTESKLFFHSFKIIKTYKLIF